MPDTRLDGVCINAVRFLAADAVQKANSGHPGTPMGAAPTAYVLWDRFLEARFTGEGRHRRRLEKVLAMERKVLHQQTHAQEGEDDC